MTTLATTERCRLDAVSEQDEALLVALHTDGDVRRYLGGAATAKAARRQLSHMMVDPTRGAMVIVLRQTAERIGIIDFHRHHDSEHIEVSYMMLPRFWGAGLAREALAKALHHRFGNDSTLDCIVAETQVANAASCRLLERLDFTEMRRLQRFDAEQALYIKHR